MSGAARTALERRSERRITVRLPMFLRGLDRDGVQFEEDTHSENICRAGAAFITRHDLDRGAYVEITIPKTSEKTQPETDFVTHGRVVFVAPGRSRGERIAGVEFTGPRFHRVFASETS